MSEAQLEDLRTRLKRLFARLPSPPPLQRAQSAP